MGDQISDQISDKTSDPTCDNQKNNQKNSQKRDPIRFFRATSQAAQALKALIRFSFTGVSLGGLVLGALALGGACATASPTSAAPVSERGEMPEYDGHTDQLETFVAANDKQIHSQTQFGQSGETMDPVKALLKRSEAPPLSERMEKSDGSGSCDVRTWRVSGIDPWSQAGTFSATFEESVATAASAAPTSSFSSSRSVSKPLAGRVVILLPPTGGLTFLDRRLARRICERGARVIAMSGFDGIDDPATDWKLHDRGFLRGLTSIRWAMRWAESRTPLGLETRFGIFGASLGGLQGALAAAHDPRIDRLVLVVAGSPLARVVARSTIDPVYRLRAPRWKEAGIRDVAEYEDRLSREIQLDFGPFLGPREGRKDFVFVSLSDDVVPTETQVELANRLGSPKKVEFSTGHLWSVVRAQTSYADEIAGHFAD